MLNIYLVKRTDNYGYDETLSYVAYAQDEATARKLGEALTGDQPAIIWHAPTTLVIRLGTSAPAAGDEAWIVHEHYR